ncbi:MAG: ATP-binding protein [Syntrophorhabdaceae bacterium]|nr:AAA family ATPase [Syntrophorhabdaceae bacterium]MDD4196921.1 ATP-binding protein [Syntrophorhabdaceae bacterium]
MITKLNPDQLYRKCDPGSFTFNITDAIVELPLTIGQDKALKSIDFGLNMDSQGFNIFAIGESGTGKMSTVMHMLKKKAADEQAPADWCYVHNFKDPDSSIALSFGPGQGVVFQKEIDEMLKVLKIEIPKAFESKEYETQKNKIIDEFQQKQTEYLTRLDTEAKERGFTVRRTPTGVLIVPVKENGEMMAKEEFEALDTKAKRKIEETGRLFQEKLNDVVRILREAEKIVREMVNRLDRMVAMDLIGPMIDVIQKKYADEEKVVKYLDDVKEDILTHLDDFKATEEVPPPIPFLKMPKPENTLARYAVNAIVDNGESKGAPVVYESNPTYLNLFGRMEYRVQYGMASTDFTMIKAGSLHKANGGYLVVDVLELLRNPFSYEALKRALKNREIRVEDVLEQYRLISTAGLKPEAIPLNAKVILIGNPYLYYLLHAYDEDSRELFKVKADFDSRMDRNQQNVDKYAMYIAQCQKDEDLLPFDNTAVARLVEMGSRFADDQDKLSTRFSDIADLIRESHYWAKKNGNDTVRAEHVTQAVNEKIDRVNRIEERLREMMLDDTLIVNTQGEKIGQVNGLAVLDMGDYSFGKPSRITAKTFMGRAGVVNLERETKMSGKIHEKAILIITSYLGGKYAVRKPISLSASITFEQLYEMIEGDSATCAELYALLSSISGVPLRQSFAVTGSMDQNGDVQPIGGVNQKIEGFFRLCKMRGLDGSNGVIIPRRNTRNLVLSEDVREAVEKGLFNVYTMDRMEEGLEILTGMKAGELQADGTYPEGTINFLVEKRLTEISEAMEKKKDEEQDALSKKKED